MLPINLTATDFRSQNQYTPKHSPTKKSKKQECPKYDESLITRTTETFQFTINALNSSLNSPIFHKIHTQAKTTKNFLIDEEGPTDLIVTLSELQKITDSKKSHTSSSFNLGLRINELAQKGLSQINAYKR